MAKGGAKDLETFMGLSGYLLGVPTQGLESLDPELGATYLRGLKDYLRETQDIDEVIGSVPIPEIGPAPLATMQLGPSSLVDLLDIWRDVGPQKAPFDQAVFLNRDRPDLSALAQKIVLLWYAAQIDSIPLDATTYDRALVWSMSYAHPQGVPRSFGYWQYSPEAVALNDPPGLGDKKL